MVIGRRWQKLDSGGYEVAIFLVHNGCDFADKDRPPGCSFGPGRSVAANRVPIGSPPVFRNICQMLGIDLETKALELAKPDLEKRLKSDFRDKLVLKVTPTIVQKEEKRKNSPVNTPKSSKDEKMTDIDACPKKI